MCFDDAHCLKPVEKSEVEPSAPISGGVDLSQIKNTTFFLRVMVLVPFQKSEIYIETSVNRQVCRSPCTQVPSATYQSLQYGTQPVSFSAGEMSSEDQVH